MGVVAYEGDRAKTGDSLTLGTTPLSNTVNPANDIFNSTISDLGVNISARNPTYQNTLGLDIDEFDASGAIAAGATSTTIHLTTANPGGETYYPGLVTFATDLQASAITATKTATDVNGGTLALGDRLNYSIAVNNGGAGTATATVLTDAVPVGTSYVPGSLTIGGVGVTDAAGDDTGDVVAGTVTARLGTGATSAVGGSLASGASTTVAFGVTVNSGQADGTTLTNTATFSNTASGFGYSGASNVVTNNVVVPPALTFNSTLPSGEVGASYSNQLTKSGGTGPYIWSIIGSLPDGITLNTSSGLLSGIPTTAATTSFTVQVTDFYGKFATKAVSVQVVAAPSITSTTPLPAGAVGAAYTTTLTASDGTTPYTWSVSTGSPPAGLTLSGAGVLSGVPSSAGTASFTVKVLDSKGQFVTQDVSLLIQSVPTVTLTSTSSATTFGTAVTFTATTDPSATGTVTFADVAPHGSDPGSPVTITNGVATLTVALPAFGANTITASYSGDADHTSATSNTLVVQVSAVVGTVIVNQFRMSGPAGVNDQYIELYNTSAIAQPLAGFTITPATGAPITLPPSAPVLPQYRSYLITGSTYSLPAIAASDDPTGGNLGAGGIEVIAPDTTGTITDKVGFTGYSLGSPLPGLTGTPTDQYAWIRSQTSGRPVNTSDNAGDFALVSTSLTAVGGQTAVLGTPSPEGFTSPYQHNVTMLSTLLAINFGASLAPNRVYTVGTAGAPGSLIVRRTITNSGTSTVTSAKIRITSISELNGAAEPDVTTQPTLAARAQLRLLNGTGTSSITVGGQPVTVKNLTVDAPAGVPGGGLGSTLTVPLPGGGLAAGQSISVAFTFAVDKAGTFWFGYNVDAGSTPIG